MKNTFDDFLQSKHGDDSDGMTKEILIEQYPEWLEDLGVDKVIEYADEYIKTKHNEYTEIVKKKKQTMSKLKGDFRTDWRKRILIREKGHRKLGINQVVEEILDEFEKYE